MTPKGLQTAMDWSTICLCSKVFRSQKRLHQRTPITALIYCVVLWRYFGSMGTLLIVFLLLGAFHLNRLEPFSSQHGEQDVLNLSKLWLQQSLRDLPHITSISTKRQFPASPLGDVINLSRRDQGYVWPVSISFRRIVIHSAYIPKFFSI